MRENENGSGLRRRDLIGAAIASAGVATFATSSLAKPLLGPKKSPRVMPAQWSWAPVPPQAPAKEGLVQLSDGTKLFYSDTGGHGECVIFLHPFTGSARVWGYQQPVFTKAGYRTVVYSRRGYSGSESAPSPPSENASSADDLTNLADQLKIDKFHAVGTAGGGFILPDYAQSYGERLLSMTIACSQGGLSEPSYREKVGKRLTVKGLTALPASFRELGPSYRLGNPNGTEEWERLERSSHSGAASVTSPAKNRTNFSDIENITTPTLVLAGAADLAAPPTLVFEMASHLQNVETGVLSESGHSGYWEQPVAFNQSVIEFIRKHPSRR